MGEVGTALNIERVAQLADQGDDAEFGALAGDAANLYIDVSSPTGGSAGDGSDTAFNDECNTLVSNGAIH